MSGQTYVTATRGDFGVVVTVYARGGAVVVRTTLSPRYALALGLDLVNLAAESVLTAEAEPAGCGARPVNPAGVSAPASNEVES